MADGANSVLQSDEFDIVPREVDSGKVQMILAIREIR